MCIAKKVRSYRAIAESDSDEYLIEKIKGWNEFQQPLKNNPNITVWRLFCRVMRQEAHDRGLKVPPPVVAA